MGLISALLLVATILALLYIFLVRPTPISLTAFLVAGAAFVWSFLPALLGRYGSLPPALVMAGVAVGVLVIFGLALLFRAKPIALIWGLVLTMPLRVPIPVGGQSVFLLAPLYLVVLAGLLSVTQPLAAGGRHTGSAAGAEDLDRPPDGRPALWREDRLRLPLAGLIAVSGLSLLYTAGPVTGAIRFFCFWVAFALAYHISSQLLDAETLRRQVTVALLGSGAVLAAVGLAERVTGSVIYNSKVAEGYFKATALRVNSLFWDPNMFGRFLVLVLIMCVVELAAGRSKRMIWFAGITAALALPALFFTFSRSSFLALGAVAILVAGRFFGAKKALIVAVVLVLVVVALFVFIDSPKFNLPKYQARLYWEKLFSGRLGLVQGGLAIFASHPLVGVGLGAFPSVFPRFRPPGYRWKVIESHNSLVTVAAELGLVGLVLLGWLLVRYVDVARRALGGRSADPMLGAVAVFGMVGIFVHSFFYGALFEDPFTWLFLALSVALAAGVSREADGLDEAEEASDY